MPLPPPRSPDSVFLDESRMRVLLVADRPWLAAEIRAVLDKSSVCCFELVHELDLPQAAECVPRDRFDLLLLDLGLADIHRSALVDVASDLATRLPVVALSGTESWPHLDPEVDPGLRGPLERVDLPGLLLRTRRRARRLGCVSLSPVFCRLERVD